MELSFILMATVTLVMAKVSAFKWLSPSVFLSGSWTIVFLLQSIFASDMYSSIYATIIIFVILCMFASGELLAIHVQKLKTTHSKNNSSFQKSIIVNENKLKKTVIFTGILSIIGALEYARVLGHFNGNFIENLLSVNSVREELFMGTISVPLVSRLGFLIGYSSVILGLSYYFLYKWSWWILLSISGILISAISQAGRAGFMMVILQVLITMLFKDHYVYKRLNIKLLLPILILVVIFFIGQFFREGFSGDIDTDSLSRVASSLRGYFFGGASAFAYYVDNYMDISQISYGRYSFSSLFAALGLYPQEAGVYDQYTPIDSIGSTSNLYSAFRSFIDDFTIIGVFIFYYLAGFFITRLNIIFIKNNIFLISTLIPLVTWLVFSPMVSLTYFNSFILSCFLPYFILRKIF